MHAEKLIMFSFFFRILFVVILEDIFSLSTAAAAAAVWLCVCCGVLCFFFAVSDTPAVVIISFKSLSVLFCVFVVSFARIFINIFFCVF